MKSCVKINYISEIIDSYDIFFIDLWGVIHNGVSVFDDVIFVLESFKKRTKWFFLLPMLQDDLLLYPNN